MSGIDTIDDWNDRLFPPSPDFGGSDSTFPEPGDCGCCAMPKCCPPRLECQSIDMHLTSIGYTDPDDSGSAWRIYRSWGDTITRTGGGTSSSGTPGTAGYETTTWSTSSTYFNGYSYDRVYYGGFSGSASDSACPHYPIISPEQDCSAGGTTTRTWEYIHGWGSGNTTGGVMSVYTHALADAEGDETEAHIAWQEAEDQWMIDNSGQTRAEAKEIHDQWVLDRDAWVDEDPENRNPEDYPEPEPPDPGDIEEPAEFYPKCWWKIISTYDIKPHYFGYNSDGSSAAPPTDDAAVQAWVDGGFSGSPGAPGVGTTVLYTDTPISSLPVYGSVTDSSSTDYTNPVDEDGWYAIAQTVFDAATFDNSECLGTSCAAQRIESAGGANLSIDATKFRYRWKLNKCCGLYAGMSWLEVFYPGEFIAWDGSGEPPVMPTTVAKAWEWTGVDFNSECDLSASIDPFDDETRWSPWSLPVEVANPSEGVKYLRNLYMVCHRSDYGTKPDLIPLYGEYNESAPAV